MKVFSAAFLLAVILPVTSACADDAVMPSSAVVIEPTSTADNALPEPAAAPALPSLQAEVLVAAVATEVGELAETQSPRQVDDAAATDLQTPDPWEDFNRAMHGFNNTVDQLVMRPLAVGYRTIAPEPIRVGVSRFFSNLRLPVTAVNQILQGRPADSVQSLGRFAINTTLGIVGVFDPATHLGLPQHDDEDFGQTLATWGWHNSRYVVLPLLGPRTVRDMFGMVGDRPLSLIGQVEDSRTAYGLQVLEVVDTRTRLLPVDELRRNTLDDYVFVRDAWSQRRNHQIEKDQHGNAD